MAEGYARQVLLPLALQDVAQDRDRLVICPPIGMYTALADIILARAVRAALSRGWATEETTLVLVGHGTNLNAHSAETAHRHAAAIRCRGAFADVGVAFLEASPTLSEALDRCNNHRHAIVVGLFADRGVHGEEDVPRLLVPLGDSAVYVGPLGTAPEISDVILAQARLAIFDLPSAFDGAGAPAPIQMPTAAAPAT
jgi:sirohydrochlorin cobaltochelatase